MSAMLVLVSAIALAWYLAQFVVSIAYRRAMLKSATPLPDAHCPRFVVFVPVRGLDATLLPAIRNLLSVDYPAFSVRILFDSREDVAWLPVQAELEKLQDSRVSVHVVESRRENCSVLCGNLVSAIEELDDSFDLVAICAADMIVPRHWLRSMAAAMKDTEAGATLGNRWYLPPAASAGGMARWMWNAGAVVAMWWCRIPWSGGMAVRVSELKQRGLLEKWGEAMVEDVSVATHFKSEPERLRFVPELIVLDREDVGFRSAVRFIRRQLLWTRLYSPRWPEVVANAVLGAVAIFAPLLLALFAAVRGEFGIAALSLAVFVGYTFAMALLLRIVELTMAQKLGTTWESFSGIPLKTVFAAIPLTQAAYAAALCGAALARSVEWRGVEYDVHGPWKIRLRHYAPYRGDCQNP